MGANPKQAIGLLLTLLAFVSLAGAFAGGGVLLWAIALALLGGGCFFFIKCKPLENE